MLLFSSLFLISCNNEVEDVPIVVSSVQPQIEEKLSFDSKADLAQILNLNNTRSAAYLTPNFVALTSPVQIADTIFNSLSAEEKEELKSSGTSYYDLLGFDKYVPNEKLANLLNSRGEIIVADTLYRVTPYGVFYTPKSYEQELDSVLVHVTDEQLNATNEETIAVSSHVKLRKTFGGAESVTSNYVVEALPQTRSTSIDNIPYQNFPVFGHKNITIVGKIIGSIKATWGLYKEMPVKSLYSGEVILAAKYENQWQGMKIFVKR